MMARVNQGDVIIEEFPAARRSLRIAIVTETYPPEVNGVAMTIGRMIRGLLERGHHIQLVRLRQGTQDQPANGQYLEEVLHRGIPIPRYDSLRVGLPAKQALVRLWSRKRPDIVHIVTEGPLGWSALAAATKLRIPCSSDFHTNFHAYTTHYGLGWLRRPVTAYLQKFHNRTQTTFVPTHSLLEELEALNFRNLQVVSRGVDTTLFDPRRRSAALRQHWGARDDALVVLYVGRLAPEKNLPLIMEAYAGIKKVRADAWMVFVGEGPERPTLEATHPDVVFAGMRFGEDLASHYASGDVFLFPSLTETFGNVTLEAMASGLAVIAYDCAAAAEHIEHGKNGVLVPVDQRDEYVRMAQSLALDPERIVRLSRAARATTERVDWDCVNQAFETALTHVAASIPGEPALAEHGFGLR